MSRLTLTYGTMTAGKSTHLLQLVWQLRAGGRHVELWTFGDRSGTGKVTSRIGLSAPARALAPGADLAELCEEVVAGGVTHVVVDEVQFATADQVDALAGLVDDHGLEVHTFGLGADFRLQPFTGTARLFAMADEVRELPLAALCWCGRPGRCNARVVDGAMVRDGEQHLIGDVGEGTTAYAVLCRRHFLRGELGVGS